MGVYLITEAREQNGLSFVAKLPAVGSGWFCFHYWLWPSGHGGYPKIPRYQIATAGAGAMADHAQNRPEGWAPTGFSK
jgi:hypothetical protein